MQTYDRKLLKVHQILISKEQKYEIKNKQIGIRAMQQNIVFNLVPKNSN